MDFSTLIPYDPAIWKDFLLYHRQTIGVCANTMFMIVTVVVSLNLVKKLIRRFLGGG